MSRKLFRKTIILSFSSLFLIAFAYNQKAFCMDKPDDSPPAKVKNHSQSFAISSDDKNQLNPYYNRKVLAPRNQDSEDVHSSPNEESKDVLKMYNFFDLPDDIEKHIVSFLVSVLDQRDFLKRTLLVSKSWLKSTENIWKIIPLTFWRHDDKPWKQIGDVQVEAIAKGNFRTLKKLYFCNNSIKSAGAKAIAEGNLSGLTLLDLSRNQIDNNGVEYLANGNLGNLIKLKLTCNHLKDAGIEYLANGNLSNLKSLALNHNMIKSGGAESLSKGNLSNLKSLNLDGNQIGDDGVKYLANGSLANLTSLILSCNYINVRGAKSLSKGNLTNLTSLNLVCNQIGDEGVEYLANGNLGNLKSLYLCDNKIGPRGALTLARGNLNNLEKLNLKNICWGIAGRKHLKLENIIVGEGEKELKNRYVEKVEY